jgi:nitrate/nitrite-specific signal transduction histidine kinase
MEDAAFTHLVVIGCSAGDVEALSEVVARLPEGFSAPVVAQHLDPDRAIHLEGILSRRSALPVRAVADVEHSGAGRISVELDLTPEKAVGRVEDDGHGLPYKNDAAANSGVGMRSMRERAALLGGDVVIVSAPGGGTRVEASIPLEEA